MLARLREVPAAERERAGKEIARRVWIVPEVGGAEVLLLYASLPEEVPTDEIAREAIRRGIGVAYPRTAPGGRMSLHLVTSPDQLRAGRWGIREPDPAICPSLGVEAVDAALIPGLAWDRAGARLGRGGGFYDRLLAEPEWRGLSCGVFFSAQELPMVPAEPWDKLLDGVVTEQESWRRLRTAVLPTP